MGFVGSFVQFLIDFIKQQTNKARRRAAMDIEKDGDSDDMAD